MVVFSSTTARRYGEMHVFVTGGSGFIGHATIRALRAAGHEVTALARSQAAADRVRESGATPVAGGLSDLAVLRESAAAADGVIHLGVSRSGDVPAADRTAAAALQDGIGARPYVHSGGVWVHGDTDGIATEASPQRPPALVAWRAANESAVLARQADGGRPVIVMPGVVFGGGASLLEHYFAGPARETGSVAYIGDGSNHVALVHVDDIADLYVRALAAPAGEAYAGTNGEYLPFREVAAALSTGLGLGGKTTSVSIETARQTMGPIADAFALDQRVSSEKARLDLGWIPNVTNAVKSLSSGDC
jgi:nucleoside-diphosphate-sugar epimerase